MLVAVLLNPLVIRPELFAQLCTGNEGTHYLRPRCRTCLSRTPWFLVCSGDLDLVRLRYSVDEMMSLAVERFDVSERSNVGMGSQI